MASQLLSQPKMAVSHINESIIMEEVMATHDPDSKDFKVNFILNFVKKILYSTTTPGKVTNIEEDEEFDVEKSNDEESDEEESNNEESEEEKSEDGESNEEESDDEEFNEEDMELPYQIKRFSFEIASKCQDRENPQSTVIYFLKMLSTYSWEAKLLMLLAAFSINIGEFSLVHNHKRLGSKLAILKGCNSPVAPSHIQQSVTQFIKLVLHLTECIVELAQSSSYNSSPIVQVACYWIVTSVLTYTSYFARFPSIDSEWLIADGKHLSSLIAKIKDLISDCRPILEKKREEESYKALWHAFSDENSIPSANLDVLKLLFNVKDGDKKKPIYDGAREEMVGLYLLKNKSLLLLISSSLDIDEYFWEILGGLRWTTKLHVLWIPILDSPALWDAKIMKKQYRYLADKGSLLSMRNLKKSVTQGFIRFVKEKLFPEFQIGGEPIIVSLDHHGRIVHRNALHMILMRALDILERISTTVSKGDGTIPLLKDMLMEKTLAIRDFVPGIDEQISDFAGETNNKINDWLRGIKKQVKNPIYSNIYTSEKENDLWKGVTWCTKLMASRPRSPISKWVDNKNYIFFIGGNNIRWVKTFVSKVLSEIKFNSQWTIKMAYIGSNMEVASVINRDKICKAPDESTLPFFWARLRSIFLSRIKFLDESHCDEECDEIVEGLKKLLACEEKGLASVDGWAVLCKGNKIVVCDLGDKMLTVMNEFEKWKESAIAKGFDQAFKYHHEMLGTTYTSQRHPCCALDYPSNFDKVPKNVQCPQCCCKMQKFVTFMCCHGYDTKVDDDDDDDDDSDVH